MAAPSSLKITSRSMFKRGRAATPTEISEARTLEFACDRGKHQEWCGFTKW